MVIISKSILNEFGVKYPDVISALNDWYYECKKANWKNINELKKDFNSAD